MTPRLNPVAAAAIGARALIVPGLIVACTLVAMGGIPTGLSAPADLAYPIALHENRTPAPPLGAGGIEPMTITIAAIPGEPGSYTAVLGATSDALRIDTITTGTEAWPPVGAAHPPGG